MAVDFPCFLDLPWEIRDVIWKAAVRPNKPGVNYFTISKNHGRVDCEDRKDALITDVPIPGIIISAPTFAPTSEGTREPASWLVNNPSSYTTDCGLWTACKESRRVMLINHRSSYWVPLRSKLRTRVGYDSHPPPKNMSTEMMHFKSKDSQDLYAVIHPQVDLFVMQANDWHCSWAGLEHTVIATPGIPARRMRSHVAIDFDPQWPTRDESFLFSVVMRVQDVLKFARAKSVWFIGQQTDRRRCHTGNVEIRYLPGFDFPSEGLRFTEMVDRTYYPSSVLGRDTPRNPPPVLRFIDRVNTMMHDGIPEVRALVCEKY